MDKRRKPLETLEKFAHNPVWKTSNFIHRFPQDKNRLDLSTAYPSTPLLKLWKTKGKMLINDRSGFRGYFLELMLVMMALTVSAKRGSSDIFFSTFSRE